MYRSSAILYRFPELIPICISVNRYATVDLRDMERPWVPAIRRLMAAKEWSQKQLCDHSGVRPNTLSDLLAGTSSRIETFTALAKALGVPMWALFCDEHEYALFTASARQDDAAQLRRDEVRAAVQAEFAPLMETVIAKLSGEPLPTPTRPVAVKTRKRAAR